MGRGRRGRELRSTADPDHMPWHPGRCARLTLADGTLVGHAGELNPKVLAALDLPARSVAFEVDLDVVIGAVPTEPVPGAAGLDVPGRQGGHRAGRGRRGAGRRAARRGRATDRGRRGARRTCGCSTSTPARRSARGASRWPSRCGSRGTGPDAHRRGDRRRSRGRGGRGQSAVRGRAADGLSFGGRRVGSTARRHRTGSAGALWSRSPPAAPVRGSDGGAARGGTWVARMGVAATTVMVSSGRWAGSGTGTHRSPGHWLGGDRSDTERTRAQGAAWPRGAWVQPCAANVDLGSALAAPSGAPTGPRGGRAAWATCRAICGRFGGPARLESERSRDQQDLSGGGAPLERAVGLGGVGEREGRADPDRECARRHGREQLARPPEELVARRRCSRRSSVG